MAALSNSTSLDNLLFNFSPPTKVVGGPTGPGKRFSAFHKSANVLPSPPACSAMHCLQPLDLESSTMLGERVHNWFDLWQQQLIRWELFHPKGLLHSDCGKMQYKHSREDTGQGNLSWAVIKTDGRRLDGAVKPIWEPLLPQLWKIHVATLTNMYMWLDGTVEATLRGSFAKKLTNTCSYFDKSATHLTNTCSNFDKNT